MPNWKEFQEQGFDFTEKELKVFEREIIQIYRDAQKAIEEKLEKAYTSLAGIDPSDSGYYNELIKTGSLETLLSDIGKAYTYFTSKAGRKTVSASQLAITNNYYRQMFGSMWVGASFGALPEELVELAVLGTSKAWENYSKKIAKKFGSGSLYQPKRS